MKKDTYHIALNVTIARYQLAKVNYKIQSPLYACKKMNHARLRSELDNIDWIDFYSITVLDVASDYFYKIMYQTLNNIVSKCNIERSNILRGLFFNKN